jgi:exonuclease VII large subunit
MKAIVGVAVALALTAASARAETVAADQAQAHVGQVTTIEGAVSNVYTTRSGTTFLDIGGRYPDNRFTVVIFKDDAGKFPEVTALAGKTIDVTGSIRLYQGRPEIILNDPAQIKTK